MNHQSDGGEQGYQNTVVVPNGLIPAPLNNLLSLSRESPGIIPAPRKRRINHMKNVHTRQKVSRFLLSIMIVSVLASSAVITFQPA